MTNMKYIAVRAFDYLDHHFAPGDEVPHHLVVTVPVLNAMAKMPHKLFPLVEGGVIPQHIQDIMEAAKLVDVPKKSLAEAKLAHPSNSTKETEKAPAEAPLTFDPSVKTVKEVLAYIKNNPAQQAAVIKAEKAGKNRAQIVGESEEAKAQAGTVED